MKNGLVVPGRFGDFTVERRREIAFIKTGRVLKMHAESLGVSVYDILGGMDLEVFIERYNDATDGLDIVG